MGAKVLLASESSRERLQRLSVVFAVGLRLKIVAELYKREMSATQFCREFGGGTPSRVAKNFKRLADTGWLRYIRSAPSASGRGREDFYRAPEMALFDHETWALLPYSMRVASSWNLLRQLAPQLRETIETSISGEGRDLTCLSLRLDELGWAHAIKAVEAQFISLFEHEKDAQVRATQSGVDLIRADVFLFAFETPTSHDGRVGPALIHRQPTTPFPERIALVLADEPCLQIVTELNRREMTARQFHREYRREFHDISPTAVRRRFEKLREICWLEIVGEQRSAREDLYRATVPAMHDDCLRPDMPNSVGEKSRWEAFDRFFAEAETAMRAGTYDARVDRYDTWSMLSLDRQAWESVIKELDALLVYICMEQERARRRMASSGEKPIAMNVTVGAYESPKDAVKAP
jgi:hypothetical protein